MEVKETAKSLLSPGSCLLTVKAKKKTKRKEKKRKTPKQQYKIK